MRYKIIENKKNQVNYLIDTETGKCLRESENIKSLKEWQNQLNEEEVYYSLV